MDAYSLMQRMEDVTILYRTFLWELPLALAQHGGKSEEERETMETAWRAYDATMRLTATATDDLCRTPLFGAMIDGALASLTYGHEEEQSSTFF